MSMTKENYEGFQQDNENYFLEESERIVENIHHHLKIINARGQRLEAIAEIMTGGLGARGKQLGLGVAFGGLISDIAEELMHKADEVEDTVEALVRSLAKRAHANAHDLKEALSWHVLESTRAEDDRGKEKKATEILKEAAEIFDVELEGGAE